ncbi:uracil phosphoribosyltransferase-domain-containing protein [Phakopsora pachyrhizi]|uniref:uracil phosphoribosyltransferase n=1 Tax=Phakopsora pachyrhizi TaxID=170000 RepID=A0AAV0B6V3_PHAPC|nr:uracil phosphoribosyltransferase-domain-containing protein [Phakopsora pachyrhizi]CAH7682768.1 uracil phosphoribosyltransferase-domain-containing protein [Phakopsora pachyrhizi]
MASNVEDEIMSELDNLQISCHPVLKHKISEMRNRSTSSTQFRCLLKEISLILAVEASRTLETQPIENLKSPISNYTGVKIREKIGISPILRAGIGMTDAFLSVFPDASVFYLGLFREKVSLQPVEYYQKLPDKPSVDTIFLLDPILATGGTAIAACNLLVDSGIPIEKIRLITVLASMPGLRSVIKSCKGLEIWCGEVDQELKDGMIVPGLGDCGDRLFNSF